MMTFKNLRYGLSSSVVLAASLILEPLAVSWLLAPGKYLLMKFRQEQVM